MNPWRPPIAPRWCVERGIRGLRLAERVRFREEVWAELYELSGSRQLALALSFWRGSAALRSAGESPRANDFWASGKDWRCRLHRHHMVRIRDLEPPRLFYEECTRCGKFFDVPYRAVGLTA